MSDPLVTELREVKIIDGFLRNAREMVVGEVSDYKGKTYGFLRILVPSAHGDGEWAPAGGMGIEAARVGELRDAVALLLDSASTDKVVARIPVGREEIHVGLQTFRGEPYAFVRRFYKKGDEWKPGRSGVNVHVDRLEDLMDLLNRLAAAAPSV